MDKYQDRFHITYEVDKRQVLRSENNL